MGTEFREFPQTSRGRSFFLLGFTLCLSVFTMFALNEAVRGRLIGSKAWNRAGKNLETHVDSP